MARNHQRCIGGEKNEKIPTRHKHQTCNTRLVLSSPSEPSHIHHHYRAPSPVSSGSRHMNTKENISRDGVGKTG